MKKVWLMALVALVVLPAAIAAVPLAVGSKTKAAVVAAPANTLHPTKVIGSTHDTSGPLRDQPSAASALARPTTGENGEREGLAHNVYPNRNAPQGADAGLQTTAPGAQIPAPIVNFEGVSDLHNPVNFGGVFPPDVNADVGPNDIVEVTNFSMSVWSKTGTIRPGFPKLVNSVFANFTAGPVCRDTNDGDPVVVYDQLADRWLVTQFALPNFPNGPFYQCIAVSQTADPTGAYNRYQFQYPINQLNDYPKFGVWPDGYYASFNEFTPPSFPFHGAGVIAYDRTKMLAGQAATMVFFDIATIDPNTGGLLPSDLNGSTLPPAGSPNYFVDAEYDDFGFPTDRLQLWKFHVDFATPANSTFTGPTVLTPNPFGNPLCNFSLCIPQKNTNIKLDTLSDRLMYRLNYRNFGDHESLVVSHSINVGSNRSGVRWYELRNPGGTASIFQQGTFAPADGLNRWMPSMNQDKNGNIAVGYSVSSATTFPSIMYAGRLSTDPAGQLSQGEGTIFTGLGSETDGIGRWGDYTSMSVDPVDDCTFWYAGEYMYSTGARHWTTRIASFKFPDCTAGGQPSISINNKSVLEGAATTTTNMTFGVKLSAASAQTVTVLATTADGTAHAPGDYTAASKTLTFVPGQIQAKFKVRVIGDGTVEPDETFFVNLTNPTNATISDNQGQGTITNDD